MTTHSSRRDFLKTSLGAACAAGVAGLAAAAPAARPLRASSSGDAARMKKGVLVDMLPKQLSYLDRFRMAREVGFEVLQANTTPDPREAAAIKEAAEKAGIPIDSVMNMDHWKYPLSSSDPAVVEKSLAGMRTSLHNAKLWGAHCVLLVPAVVNEQTSYHDAWVRSQAQIRKLIPLAQELRVVIGLEEVWNKFLLSPLEFARYVDEFKSPWIGAWFDVGNVVLYGYPQDWIRTLGHRIVDVHVKGFKRAGNCYEWVNIGDGDIDWPEVRKAFAEIGYHGPAITELKAGDEAYLRDVSNRVSKYVLGE
ncbi:MAG: sugar phosphate isomerase/epimerase family protein [Terriglobia bacterium]